MLYLLLGRPGFNYCNFGNIRGVFIFAKLRICVKFRKNKILVKLLCHLLMKVNHVIVANVYVANMSFNAICENIILRKFPNLQYSGMQLYVLLSPKLCFIFLICLDLYMLGDDTSIS